VSSVSPQPADGRGGLRAAVSRSALRLQSDRRLVALTRGGSSVAFSVIVERYRSPLLAYALRLVAPDEAEDALQQTFTNALGALHRDDRPIELRPWLYRIAHNVSVNTLRRSGRHHEQLDEQFDGVPQPPDVLEQKLRVQRLVQGIGELPERQRAAIVAHELEGRSYEEIAHNMSATTPVVRQLVHRARTRLRDACGVLVPAWALRWLVVADLRAPGGERVGEAVAGGATGAGLLKAGTALLATGAIATGAGGLVVKHDRRPAREPQASAAAQPDAGRAAQGHGSVAGPLQAHLQERQSHPRPESGHTPGEAGGGQRGARKLSGKRHRDDPHVPARPDRHRSPDDSAGQGGSGESGSGDTHEASYDGSDDRHADGSRGSAGGGDPSGDGSGGGSGGPDGPDSHGSGSPDSPPVGPTEP
jgi:RNA polymerase sigma factor (sigma-70 family)